MARQFAPWGLRILAPCLLISIGTALAEESELANLSESPQVSEPQHTTSTYSPDVYSSGISPTQDPPPSIAAEPPVLPGPRYSGATALVDSNSVATGLAQDSPSPIAAKNPIIPQHIAVSSYADADSLGNRTVYAAGTIAPFGGIYESGWRFRASGDASWYRFVTGENPRTLGKGHYIEGDFLVGYGLWVPRFNITGFVGPAYAQIDNLGTTTQRWGVKASVEMSAKPTDWTIASASVSYSTVENNLQVQAKTGLKIFDGVYVGPEAKFQWQRLLPVEISFFTPAVTTATPVSPDRNISYIHLGAFSALNVGPVAVGLSGGWAHDQQLGSGYYGSASLYVPF
jgi:cellulose biosynthesis protein BcsS